MKKLWLDEAWKEYLDWQEQDKRILKKINELIREAERTPFKGTGKPEPLRGDRSGYWSRRITSRDRLVYRVKDGVLEILSCMGHYED